MATMIEAMDDQRVERIQVEVFEWAKTRDAIYDLRGAIENAQDGFAGRLKWAIAYVAKLEREQELDEYFLDLFSNEIFGSLIGKSEEERATDRRSQIVRRLIYDD